MNSDIPWEFMCLPTDLGGTAEVAEALGCPRQQVYSLRRRKDFPKPVHTVRATPLWFMGDIKVFALTWKRRKSSTKA